MTERHEDVERRRLTDLLDPRTVALIAAVLGVVALVMIAQGASHDAFHDARHVAGVACH